MYLAHGIHRRLDVCVYLNRLFSGFVPGVPGNPSTLTTTGEKVESYLSVFVNM